MKNTTNNNENSYFSFNDLNRPAMFLGVPMMFSLFLGFFILLLSVLFFLLFKLIGLIIVLFCGGCLFFVCRIICENDPNGLYNKKYFVLGFLLRLKNGISVIVLSSNPNRTGKL